MLQEIIILIIAVTGSMRAAQSVCWSATKKAKGNARGMQSAVRMCRAHGSGQGHGPLSDYEAHSPGPISLPEAYVY